METDIEEIARKNLLALVGKPFIAIEERDGEFIVHQHSEDSVCPQVSYPTKRLAASRVLQLLHIGPVAPQDHPETMEIGHVETETATPTQSQ